MESSEQTVEGDEAGAGREDTIEASSQSGLAPVGRLKAVGLEIAVEPPDQLTIAIRYLGLSANLGRCPVRTAPHQPDMVPSANSSRIYTSGRRGAMVGHRFDRARPPGTGCEPRRPFWVRAHDVIEPLDRRPSPHI